MLKRIPQSSVFCLGILSFAFVVAFFPTYVWGATIDATVKITVCGDSIVETPEECDGLNLNGASCELLGFVGGTLSCSFVCEFNTTLCVVGSPDVQPDEEESSGSGGGARRLRVRTVLAPFVGVTFPNELIPSIIVGAPFFDDGQDRDTSPSLEIPEFNFNSTGTMVEILEVPSLAYSNDGFLVRGKTVPNTTVRVWLEGPPEPLVPPTGALGSLYQLTKRLTNNHLKPHYHVATVDAEGNFILEHPPVAARDAGQYTLWAEVVDENGSRIALTGEKTVRVEASPIAQFEEGMVEFLFLSGVVILFWIMRFVWVTVRSLGRG